MDVSETYAACILRVTEFGSCGCFRKGVEKMYDFNGPGSNSVTSFFETSLQTYYYTQRNNTGDDQFHVSVISSVRSLVFCEL